MRSNKILTISHFPVHLHLERLLLLAVFDLHLPPVEPCIDVLGLFDKVFLFVLVWLHVVFVIMGDRCLVADGFVHWCWGNGRLQLDVVRTLVVTGGRLLLVDPMGLSLASLQAGAAVLSQLGCLLQLPDLELLSLPQVVAWVQFVRGLIWFQNGWVARLWLCYSRLPGCPPLLLLHLDLDLLRLERIRVLVQ